MARSVTVVGRFGFWRLWDGPAKVSHAHRGRDPRLAHRTREGRVLVVHLKAFHNEPSPPDPDKWYLVLGMGETTGLWNV